LQKEAPQLREGIPEQTQNTREERAFLGSYFIHNKTFKNIPTPFFKTLDRVLKLWDEDQREVLLQHLLSLSLSTSSTRLAHLPHPKASTNYFGSFFEPLLL
jgi:hypothetical protein